MKTMEDVSVLRSFIQSAARLCCVIPVVAAVSAKAAGSYEWSSNGDLDNLQISIVQTGTLVYENEAWSSPVDIFRFDADGFSGKFWSELSSVDTLLPFYSRHEGEAWSLSSVLIELSATSPSSLVGNFDAHFGDNNAQFTGPLTVSVGQFLLDGDNTGASVVFTHTDDTGPHHKNATDIDLSSNSGSVSGTPDVNDFKGTEDAALSFGLASPPTVGNLAYETTNGKTGEATANNVQLTSVTLNVKITYIVTPEPGTMALLLTGVPLLLVRRRKGWKKE